ncbi:unnamed protein product [Protopolystoma xenopodis]|uniref:Uncharacterized protein n=1 Tax=Protopolystoma xenopodis TaxID=117903 RepID=A0A3S5AUU0_9PLAT|nr:unnamed protein product [Protopolystoma xenopodis]
MFSTLKCQTSALGHTLITGKCQNRVGQAEAGCNLAFILATDGQTSRARLQYALAREAAHDADLPIIELQACEALAALELYRGRHQRAASYLHAAITLCPAIAAKKSPQIRQVPHADKNIQTSLSKVFGLEMVRKGNGHLIPRWLRPNGMEIRILKTRTAIFAFGNEALPAWNMQQTLELESFGIIKDQVYTP